jgi:adenine-specific DNA-methyltransferase
MSSIGGKPPYRNFPQSGSYSLIGVQFANLLHQMSHLGRRRLQIVRVMVDGTAQCAPRPRAQLGVVAEEFEHDKFRPCRGVRELAEDPLLALTVKPHSERAPGPTKLRPRGRGSEVDVATQYLIGVAQECGALTHFATATKSSTVRRASLTAPLKLKTPWWISGLPGARRVWWVEGAGAAEARNQRCLSDRSANLSVENSGGCVSYRYLGNKTKLADWILGVVSQVLPKSASIADPMCGTAAMSMAFARSGYSVTAADALTFPVVHAQSRLLAKATPEFAAFGGYEGALAWMRSVEPEPGYFHREFSADGRPANGRSPRLYFSGRNAAHIDALRVGIRSLRDAGDLTEIEHSVLLHHLILATNAVANITGTYGYFRSELSQAAMRPPAFEPLRFENTPGHHKVLQGQVETVGPTLGTDAVYLDPPYTKRQYAGNYHVLETLAREDEPEAIGDGGLRPWREQASNFCYKRMAGQAFRETLKRIDTRHVFISYSEDGQVSKTELESILSDFGRVTMHELPHPRFRSNDRVKDGGVLERLYHIEAF